MIYFICVNRNYLRHLRSITNLGTFLVYLAVKLQAMKRLLISLFTITILFTSCSTTQQILNDVLGAPTATRDPNNQEVGMGLKAALEKGAVLGANNVGKVDGFFKNGAIKILFPPEAKKVESALRNLGLGQMCDRVILSVNRAAEDAAPEAKQIFVGAIKQLTIPDAMNILFGADDAATRFLQRTTTTSLKSKFRPKIDQSLNKVNATKYWGDVITRYNKIPFVQKVNTDLGDFVTEKAISGLFLMVEKEEKKIRENPLERTTAILKQIFGYYDSKKG